MDPGWTLPSTVPVVTSVVAKTTSVALGSAGGLWIVKLLTDVAPQSSPLPKRNVAVPRTFPAEQSPFTRARRYAAKTTSGPSLLGGGLKVEPPHATTVSTAAASPAPNRRRAGLSAD